MKRSNYLIWFRRLVVLGAVVAGLTASAAGAVPMLDPQDTPITGTNVPDYGPYPISGGTGFNQVVTWPTSADGLRWQAIAKAYQPNAKTGSAPKVDPLAVGYLIGQGLSPNEVTSWTTGACSHQVKASSCYAMLDRSATSTKAVDPLAVGYLIGQGLTPSQVTSWTVGACSQAVKAASCYAMFKPASTSSTKVAGSTGFQWGDAGIGAGIILLLGGASAGFFLSRHNRGQQTARA
jgi:hypothetical protein